MAVKQKPVQRTYRVLDIPEITDGDSLWVVREWTLGDDGEGTGEILRRDYQGGTNVRLDDGLLGLNTPEKRDDPERWLAAKTDLENYLKVVSQYGFDLVEYGRGGFGRLLGNLIPRSDSHVTPVQFMRMRGWEAYK